MRFQDKVVIITGASAGIGLSTAWALAREGAALVINSQNPERCNQAADSLKESGAEIVSCPGDVSDEKVAEKLVNTAINQFGHIDILINCAGIVPAGDITKTTPEEWDHVMTVNVKSVYLTCHYAAIHMLKQKKGNIVNVSSIVADRGIANRALYSASKGAVSAMTRAMAADYITDNIRVNCVCPGTIYTPSLQERIGMTDDPAAEKAAYEARQPMKRLGTPEEVAYAILYLCDDEASFITGSSLYVDGGAVALK